MTQNERLTQAELNYLRSKIPPYEPFVDQEQVYAAESKFKSEASTWLFRLAVALVFLGVAFGLGYWAGRAGL